MTDNYKAREIDSATIHEFDTWLQSRYTFENVIGKSAATLALETWAYLTDSQRRTIRELKATIAEKDAKIKKMKMALKLVNTLRSAAVDMANTLQSDLTASREECERYKHIGYVYRFLCKEEGPSHVWSYLSLNEEATYLILKTRDDYETKCVFIKNAT